MKKLLFTFTMMAAFIFVKASEPIDVTAQYLLNYAAPFETTGESVLNDNPRWEKLAAPWVTENDFVDENGNITGWHRDIDKSPNYPSVDASRAGVMTITPGWDGFSGTVTNAKIYQTITLPAGQYEFVTQRAQDWTGAAGAYFVVAKGAGIPNIGNWDDALGYFHFADANDEGGWLLTVSFKLEEETEVSVGAVATYNSVQQCVTLAEFWIYTFEGANYRLLEGLVTTAQKYKPENYPIGTFAGTYPQAKWDAFVAALAAAEAFLDNKNDDIEQEVVDAEYDNLKAAMDDLNGSLVLPFRVSDENEEFWYQLRDKRATPTYWTTGEFTLYVDENDFEGTFYPMALAITQEPDAESDQQLFKVVKAPAPAKGYHIFNKEFDGMPLVIDREKNVVVIDFNEEHEDATWLFAKTSSQVHYNVFDEKSNNQMNSFVTYDPQRIGFYNHGEDLGNMWQFVLAAGDGVTDYTDLIELYFKAFKMTADKYPVGSEENQFDADAWDTFVLARDMTLAMLERSTTNDEPSQGEVDTMYDMLSGAIQELLDSQNPPIFLSDDVNEYWYLVVDQRATPSVWHMDDQDEDYESVRQQLVMIKGLPAEEDVTDSIYFKFEQEEGYNGYFIYSKLHPQMPLAGDVDGNFIGIDEYLEPSTWILTGGNASYPGAYLMAIENEEGEAANELNSHAGWSPPIIGFYDGGWGDMGNRWTFRSSVTTSVKEVKPAELRIFVINRTILTENPEDKLIVHNVNGQLVDARKQLTQGVYIVRIEGKAGASKVIVR